jgi:hypothetical protein
MVEYRLVSGKTNPELVEVHNWLPNQELHFDNVRCLECHTQVQDSLMVSHNILSKDQALRRCNDCHSANSMLKASLYKYENLQARSEEGKVGTVLTNQAYIIGANQSPTLKWLSYVIFFLAIGGICIHLFFRIIKK